MKKVLTLLLITVVFVSSVFSAKGKIETIEDLNGSNIGVQTAVLYEDLIRDRVPDSTFQYYTMPNDMIYALTSGKVDAYLIEEVSFGVQKAHHPELECLDEPAGYINATCIIGNNERQDRILKETRCFERLIRGGNLTPQEAELLTPDRELDKAVYRFLRSRETWRHGEEILCSRISESRFGAVCSSVEAMKQMGLININGGVITLPQNTVKVNLEDAPILKRLKELREGEI